MKKILSVLFFISFHFSIFTQNKNEIISPSKKIVANFWIDENGAPKYSVAYKSKIFIEESGMGFELIVTNSRKKIAAANKNFKIIKIDAKAINTSWKPVWGEENLIKDNYIEKCFSLTHTSDTGIKLNIYFKLYDDGVAFRYEFPTQKNLTHFIIKNETTEFNLTGNHKAFWIPGDYDTNEFNPNTTELSNIDASNSKFSTEIYAKTFISNNAVQTPLMLKTIDNLYINIHEAALINYPAMNLEIDKKTFTFSSHLVPDALGNKAYLAAPAKTPWRTIIVSDKATEILASRLILNCNEPSKIKDVSYIKPTKYIGMWWEMHVGKATWDYAGSQDMNSWENLANAKPTGKHGANTKRIKQYIDFASKHGFDGVLVEGWNVGWEDWFGRFKEDVFDFVTPYPDFDVAGLQKYATQKNVKMIMHHETSGSVTNYERYMDTAYRFMKKFGYNAVKTGYVGPIIPRGEHHDGQWMVKHFERVMKKTANYKIMVDMHEPLRPTGLHRTYPNFMACEAARGMEFNAWSNGNEPEHETIYAFTRFMGGPMDYTPGIFQLDLSYWDKTKKEKVRTTLAKQLALYVTIASPLQMAADIPEVYEKKLDAFQFIKDVPVDWDKSLYLEAEPGDYITIARKAKNKNNWFIGAITDENPRQVNINLDFLDENKTYDAIIYSDAADTDYLLKADTYQISKLVVKKGQKLSIDLKASGGCAISIIQKK